MLMLRFPVKNNLHTAKIRVHLRALQKAMCCANLSSNRLKINSRQSASTARQTHAVFSMAVCEKQEECLRGVLIQRCYFTLTELFTCKRFTCKHATPNTADCHFIQNSLSSHFLWRCFSNQSDFSFNILWSCFFHLSLSFSLVFCSHWRSCFQGLQI